MWITCGILSVVFTAANWMLTTRNHRKAGWATFCALAFTALILLMEYRMVLDWVNASEWDSLIDVVPSMFKASVVYVIVMLVANAFAFAARKTDES